MEEQVDRTRSRQEDQIKSRVKVKKKRLRKFRLFLTTILILIIAIFIFSFIQYKKGLKLANNDDTKIKVENFVGDEEGDVVNYLLLGLDSRKGENSRTDTMMILSKNKKTNEFKLVSFMRDIYAEIPGYKNYKLNTAYFLGEKKEKGQGVQLLKETLNNMFDIPIHHYAIVDFKTFESLVDIVAPDGVNIDVEKNISDGVITLKEGEQTLNGKKLLTYARFRKDAEGDFGRVRRQQQVIHTLKEQVLKPSNIVNIPKLTGAIQGYITTDLTSTEEIKFALSIIKSDSSELEKLTIPVEGSYKFGSYSHAGSVIEIDKEKNKKELHKFLGIDN